MSAGARESDTPGLEYGWNIGRGLVDGEGGGGMAIGTGKEGGRDSGGSGADRGELPKQLSGALEDIVTQLDTLTRAMGLMEQRLCVVEDRMTRDGGGTERVRSRLEGAGRERGR